MPVCNGMYWAKFKADTKDIEGLSGILCTYQVAFCIFAFHNKKYKRYLRNTQNQAQIFVYNY